MRAIAFLTAWGLLLVAAHPTTSQQTAQVIRSGADLVTVTIVARDKKAAPVAGLTAADLTVTEDGKPVTPAFVREVTDSGSKSSVDVTPAGTFSNTAEATAAPNVTVILFDRLNTNWEDQARARDQLKLFLGQLRADDRVAIYALDGGALRVLHEFTTDASSLLRVIDGSARLTSEHLTAQSDPNQSVFFGHGTGAAEYTTITALETMAQHLSGIVGRKNVVWVSGGFDLGLAMKNNGRGATAEMDRAARALSGADISLYAIDARGLVGSVKMSATSDTFTTADVINPNQEIMQGLAELTGGRAFLNHNDIAASVRAAVDDAEHHYELGYYSPSPRTDGHYRAIVIKTGRPGVALQYRRGYFATPAAAPGGDRRTALDRAVSNPLDATGLPLAVTPTRAASTSSSGGADDGIELSIHLPGERIALTQSNGSWTGSLDLVIAQVHRDGTTRVNVDTTLALHLSGPQHDALLDQGLKVAKAIMFSAQADRLAIVVRDASTGVVGSVVISAAKLHATLK